jgi:hypothetical protein
MGVGDEGEGGEAGGGGDVLVAAGQEKLVGQSKYCFIEWSRHCALQGVGGD